MAVAAPRQQANDKHLDRCPIRQVHVVKGAEVERDVLRGCEIAVIEQPPEMAVGVVQRVRPYEKLLAAVLDDDRLVRLGYTATQVPVGGAIGATDGKENVSQL